MGKFWEILTELSAQDTPIFLFPDDNLRKCQGILTKLGTCIDMIWFGIANGQILAMFDRVIFKQYHIVMEKYAESTVEMLLGFQFMSVPCNVHCWSVVGFHYVYRHIFLQDPFSDDIWSTAYSRVFPNLQAHRATEFASPATGPKKLWLLMTGDTPHVLDSFRQPTCEINQ